MKERTGYPKVEVTAKWNGCLLVNPLCPDDLCWLPADKEHPHKWHCLSTSRWCDRFTIGNTAFFMSKVAQDAYDLYIEGWQAQFKLSPSELEFRREVWDPLFIEEILAYPGKPGDHARQVDFLTKVRKGHVDPDKPRREARPSMNPTGYRARHRNQLLNRSRWNRKKPFPCWCGESLMPRYRQMGPCCVDYLFLVGPFVYLDLS